MSNKKKVKIIVCGALGKMGQRIMDLLKDDPHAEVIAGVEELGHPAVGENNPPIVGALEEVIEKGDVLIDFTSVEATLEHVTIAAKHQVPMVIGTTGFSPEQHTVIEGVSKDVPLVLSPNMSMGVSLLFYLVGQVAKFIPQYDVEIHELHHNQKKDSPSGTAAKLAEVIAESLGRNIEDVGVYGRHGVIGVRPKDEIGVMALRGGDIVGEHTVFFAGPGERIEVTHRAHSRDTFASGSIQASKWIVEQKPGLYDVRDMLGFDTK